MEGAQPGHTVEFQGLQGAAHLNGTRGTLVRFHSRGDAAGRWAVRCDLDNACVNAKPENLRLTRRRQQHQPRGAPDLTGDSFRTIDPGMAFAGGAGRPDSWLRGLSAPDKYEWLSNCYQMRCDDDYQWGGGDLRGPYDPQATPESITQDFMAFCLLAKRRNVVPSDWDWSAFLQVASANVPFAFEKSDARERWGSENVFEAATGGRSLRYTAEQIYCSAVNDPDRSREQTGAEDEVRTNKEAVQNEIGGAAIWDRFVSDLAGGRRFSS